MALKIYDPDQSVVYFAGIRLQGFADGEYITAEMKSDGFTSVVGTDGEVARSKSNDKRCLVTVKLLHTSSSNAQLSGVLNTDLNAPNGAGVGAFMLADNSTPTSAGTPLVVGAEAWIVKAPDLSRDRTTKSLEWQIEIAECTRFEGGA
jgi:hypothetical protein